MKKLLLAISCVLALAACKSKRTAAHQGSFTDSARTSESLRVIQPPASDNANYDSLKHELDKKRREKKK